MEENLWSCSKNAECNKPRVLSPKSLIAYFQPPTGHPPKPGSYISRSQLR